MVTSSLGKLASKILCEANTPRTSLRRLANQVLCEWSGSKHAVIVRGKLLETKDATMNLSTPLKGQYPDPVDFEVEYQLYDERNNPISGTYANYDGKVTYTEHDGHNFVMFGNPYHDATLTEYRIDKEPTDESWKRYENVKAGVASAMQFKPGKRLAAKGHDWLYGYDEIMKWRKRNGL
jgi:hypothetical protein